MVFLFSNTEWAQKRVKTAFKIYSWVWWGCQGQQAPWHPCRECCLDKLGQRMRIGPNLLGSQRSCWRGTFLGNTMLWLLKHGGCHCLINSRVLCTDHSECKFIWSLWNGDPYPQYMSHPKWVVMVSVKKIFFFTYLFIPLSTEKKKKKRSTVWELWVEFYWGQNEGYRLGDSISGNSEELLQRGGAKVSVIYDFGEGGTCCQAQILVEACC